MSRWIFFGFFEMFTYTSDNHSSDDNASANDIYNCHHNFCRNPTGDESGPWCYVKSDDDKFVEWEECNVDQVQYCKDPAAYVERDDVKPEETTTMAMASKIYSPTLK
ncbi:Oidioi.mRNA.OKI2018_I69.XSR.g15956.t1.cds [Oikopleura dioica]|uniref:Oidioi.mRNA.OKI2018_I69.XSR.g15956.t1.cds n=1 Tax=Oikopleura dioica TaxID=34765 RepID=A0ABN7SEI0_OIKDI|nr:Oidioi.mRNA.OKI2018_I69.XSR.g15956.t1.cds [Oikopleura dioica]